MPTHSRHIFPIPDAEQRQEREHRVNQISASPLKKLEAVCLYAARQVQRILKSAGEGPRL